MAMKGSYSKGWRGEKDSIVLNQNPSKEDQDWFSFWSWFSNKYDLIGLSIKNGVKYLFSSKSISTWMDEQKKRDASHIIMKIEVCH